VRFSRIDSFIAKKEREEKLEGSLSASQKISFHSVIKSPSSLPLSISLSTSSREDNAAILDKLMNDYKAKRELYLAWKNPGFVFSFAIKALLTSRGMLDHAGMLLPQWQGHLSAYFDFEPFAADLKRLSTWGEDLAPQERYHLLQALTDLHDRYPGWMRADDDDEREWRETLLSRYGLKEFPEELVAALNHFLFPATNPLASFN
jgi:hypothetical protein